MDRDSAVLQGSFLLADKLCRPSSLSSLQKADWSRVGHVVAEALKELCERGEINWTERIVCVVWLKLLCREAGEDVEESWRRNPFFPLQNSLPELNRVVLLELVKLTGAARVFAQFLLCFPPVQLHAELERFTEHVKSSPTTEEDVLLFLQVWWELWKGRDEQKAAAGGEGMSTRVMFANQLLRLFSDSSSPNYQSAKRLKLESTDSPESQPNRDILQVFLHALTELKAHISSTGLCFQALSVSLNAVYTSFLIDAEVELSPERKLQMLSQMVSSRGMNSEQLSSELIREAQRDIRACHTPSEFRPSSITLREALEVVTELAEFWKNNQLLRIHEGSGPSHNTFQLEQSIQRVLTALCESGEDSEESTLGGLLKSLELPSTEAGPEVSAEVTAVVIAHRLEDYESFAVLFADKTLPEACGESWLDCLEKNQTAFRQHDAVIALSSTLRRKLHSQSSDVNQCRKLMKITADVFSALSLEEKNKALAATLRSSSRGFFQLPVAPAVTEGFEKELNMAFNCIIQGGGRASAANLNTAVSLVARVSFQNPEAALKSCCQSAIFNKGVFSLMAAILQQLPGLRGQASGGAAQDEQGGGALLCSCLQESIGNKSLSNMEEEQFLKFVSLLMAPGESAEGEERRPSFLPPQDVINAFVLPNISAAADVDRSLQLLQAALSLDEGSPPHWVMLCSPFPLLYILSQLLHQTFRFWEQTPGGAVHSSSSMDRKDVLSSVLSRLGAAVGAEVAAAPSRYSRALFWLYDKTGELDWTVRFHLKPVWGEHFKNEVPSSLLTVCDLPEQEWSGSDLPPYGPGTGLLAWMECCCISDALQAAMLSGLALDRTDPEQVGMFSKGLLLALTQVLPWCSAGQWARLLRAVRELVSAAVLHVPFSLEYVDHLPLLDLRSFSCELRLSVLLLRSLQLLCGSSCSGWLPAEGWAHVGRLYALAVRDMVASLRAKQPLPAATPAKEGAARSQEVLFVLSQLYCHVQHIQVMMPGGQCEALFLSSLDILSHYQAVMAAFPDSCTSVESADARHFFSTITDNLQSREMKAVLQQKIAQLVSSAA